MLTFLFSIAAIWTLFWLIMYLIDWNENGRIAEAKSICATCGPTVKSGGKAKSNAATASSASSTADQARKKANKAKQQNTAKKPVADKHDQVNVKPLFKAPKEKDDLKVIKGIGVVMERTLNDLGITTFKQLAEFKKADVLMVSEALEGFGDRIERDEWVGQAKQIVKKAS